MNFKNVFRADSPARLSVLLLTALATAFATGVLCFAFLASREDGNLIVRFFHLCCIVLCVAATRGAWPWTATRFLTPMALVAGWVCAQEGWV